MLFEIKLEELEKRYGEMKKRITISESKNQKAIEQELVDMKKEYQANESLLEKCVASGCQPAISALALAQLTYCRQTEKILEDQMNSFFHSELGSETEREAEALALYAEYAIDFATMAIDHALIAALSAESLNMKEEEDRDERS